MADDTPTPIDPKAYFDESGPAMDRPAPPGPLVPVHRVRGRGRRDRRRLDPGPRLPPHPPPIPQFPHPLQQRLVMNGHIENE